MPLTPAEKMKRYRERLKANDPEKYEEQAKKNLDRIKAKKKKVSEMTQLEIDDKRQLWREEKRKKRIAIKQINLQITTEKVATADEKRKDQKNNSKYKLLLRSYKEVLKKYACAKETIRRQNKSIELLKKRLQRTKVKSENVIEKMEKTMSDVHKKEIILKTSLQETYKNLKGHKLKRAFKDITNTTIAINNKYYLGQCIGLKGKIRKTTKIQKKTTLKKDIHRFFMREDVSRSTSGKRETRTLKKNKEQVYYLTDSLERLYKKYQQENGKAAFSTFCSHKPFFVLQPNDKNRRTCVCIKHENMQLKLNSLKREKIVDFKDLNDILLSSSCDINSRDCMFGKCEKCNNKLIKYNSFEEDRETTWLQWVRVDHEYQKTDIQTNTKKICTTKKTIKEIKRGMIDKLKQDFEDDIPIFKLHYFIMMHQINEYNKITRTLSSAKNECSIHCDFSENYQCKYAREIQAVHFGASHSQITLHTGIIYYSNGESQTFCTVSPCNDHQPGAIWAHLSPVIKMAKEKIPDMQIIHFWSDGPSSQYRQKKIFFLMNVHTKELNLNYTTWSFFESGHGKGVADGVGGAVKRMLDREVAYGADIVTAQDAFDILENRMKSVKCFFIREEEIISKTDKIPSNLPTLVGTMKIHQIISQSSGVIRYRDLSCFCGPLRGLCACFAPKNHKFPKNTSLSDQQPNVQEMFYLPLDETDGQEVASYVTLFEENIMETTTPLQANLEEHLELSNDRERPNLDLSFHHEDDQEVASKIIIFDPKGQPITVPQSKDVDEAKGNLMNDEITYNLSDKEDEDCLQNKCRGSIPLEIAVNENAQVQIPEEDQCQIKFDGPIPLPIGSHQKPSTSRKIHLKNKNSTLSKCAGCNQPTQRKISCMCCKKKYCIVCTEGCNMFDYICMQCLA